MEGGQPVPEPVSVGLNCGMSTVQAVHSDSKGYFQFTLGMGPQSTFDMSASDDTIRTSGVARSLMTMGCELQISVSGYLPLSKSIVSPPDLGEIDAGTLFLKRIAGVEGSSISVTSLQVPDNARKEFEKGEKDEQNKHLDTATQHLEKAVSLYDKYAAAWNELGKVHLANREADKATQSFAKAIEADPKYIPPYLSLAALQLEGKQFDSALDTAGKVLELDHSIGTASFIQAAAEFQLGRLDEAEKSAREAANQPHDKIPQVHILLAQILLQKQDYLNAAAEMRSYLKEAPNGPFAAQAKQNIAQIEKDTANASGKSSAPPAPPRAAP